MSGGIGQKVGQEIIYDYIDPINSSSEKITVKQPDVSVYWSTTTIDLKTQASMSFLFFTPYIGLGASHGTSKAGYKIKTTVTDTGNHIGTASNFFEQFGIDDITQKGFSSEIKDGGWSFRTYGGISFNLALVRIDLTGLYNFVDKNYGATLGLRLQF
jgi:hypothetical protein